MEKKEIEVELPVNDIKWFSEAMDCELEMMQGERTEPKAGHVLFKFHLQGEKLEVFKDFCKSLMSLPTDKIKVKYMGQKINQN